MTKCCGLCIHKKTMSETMHNGQAFVMDYCELRENDSCIGNIEYTDGQNCKDFKEVKQ